MEIAKLTSKGQLTLFANIDNVIASMNIEGLEVSQESIDYMKNRANGDITVEERVKQIKNKYRVQ